MMTDGIYFTKVDHNDPLFDEQNEYLRAWRDVTACYLAWQRQPDLPYYSLDVERFKLMRQYAFAIPDDNALRIIAQYAPIVEIGAGNGYWAYLLRQRGVDVIAYDVAPNQANDFWQDAEYRPWTEVLVGTTACAADHADRTLFLCWPPYNAPMAHAALDAYQGSTVIFIGEHNGMTGDAGFFEQLYREWHCVETHFIPCWNGIHDYLSVYQRKEQTL